MPTRVHYVFVPSMSGPRFDNAARQLLQDLVIRKSNEIMSFTAGDAMQRRIGRLPHSFRKAIPELEIIAKEIGLVAPLKRLKKFRLPKHLRLTKNPIFSWKSL